MFKCQFLIGRTSASNEVNFTAYQGVMCEDAKNPSFVFDTLQYSYNSLSKARKLVEGGDISCFSGEHSRVTYIAKKEGSSAMSTYTGDINEYKRLMQYVPPVFLFCTRLNDWLFFTKSASDCGEYDVVAHLVSSLSIRTVTPPMIQ